tara:strand:+ start:574 stop:1161 length:588 start_codon:yes stop_codon:yes gene_type:complete
MRSDVLDKLIKKHGIKTKPTPPDLLETYVYLAERQLEECKAATKVNPEIIKTMAGNEGERIIARLVNGKVVFREFDVLSIDGAKLSNGITIKEGDRIEVKTAIYRTSGKVFAYSLDSKQDACDFVALVDMTGGYTNTRISIIPQDVFFEEGEFNRYGKKLKERFSWSASYNKDDNQKPINTQLFESYEVKYERIT